MSQGHRHFLRELGLVVWRRRPLTPKAKPTIQRARSRPRPKPAPEHRPAKEESLRIRALRVMHCCIVYALGDEEQEDLDAQEQLVRRMLIKCGASEQQIQRAQLNWPNPILLAAAGDHQRSVARACLGFLDGLGCRQVVVMGQNLWALFGDAAQKKFIHVDSPAALLRQPTKRKAVWQELLPLRKTLANAAP